MNRRSSVSAKSGAGSVGAASTPPPPKRGGKSGPLIAPPSMLFFGIGGLLLSLAIVFVFPALNPNGFLPIQVVIVATLTALSGAAISNAITGILKLQTSVLVAGGPFVVFVIVFWATVEAGAPGVLPNIGTLFDRLRGRRS